MPLSEVLECPEPADPGDGQVNLREKPSRRAAQEKKEQKKRQKIKAKQEAVEEKLALLGINLPREARPEEQKHPARNPRDEKAKKRAARERSVVGNGGEPGFTQLEVHGWAVRDAIQRFVEVFNSSVAKETNRGVEIRVSHGYSTSDDPSSYTIKNMLTVLCRRFEKRMTCLPGGRSGNNPGMTTVIPLKKIPAYSQKLHNQLEAMLSRARFAGGDTKEE